MGVEWPIRDKTKDKTSKATLRSLHIHRLTCFLSTVCAVPVGTKDQPPDHTVPAQRQPRVPASHGVLHLQTRVWVRALRTTLHTLMHLEALVLLQTHELLPPCTPECSGNQPIMMSHLHRPINQRYFGGSNWKTEWIVQSVSVLPGASLQPRKPQVTSFTEGLLFHSGKNIYTKPHDKHSGKKAKTSTPSHTNQQSMFAVNRKIKWSVHKWTNPSFVHHLLLLFIGWTPFAKGVLLVWPRRGCILINHELLKASADTTAWLSAE